MKRPWIPLVPFVLAACQSVDPNDATVLGGQIALQPSAATKPPPAGSKTDRIRALYTKREVKIPMRDGVELFTAIYTPKDTTRTFPILLRRTPYSCRPYGSDAFPETPGPSDLFTDAGYGFAIQDVRGAYMSGGEFVDVRPHDPDKRSKSEIDESTDAWDTIDWLVKNIAHCNGAVGMWGISYPGFYAAAGMIDAHPSLKAVSPQAPIADWWWDDFHHHGALFLPHSFLFLAGFGRPRPVPVTDRNWRSDWGTPDGYAFFLRSGVIDLGREHMRGEVRFWEEAMAHPNRDAFWKERDLLPHLDRVAPAVMTVGGLFDAEDLYGPLAIHRTVERKNPGIVNTLVMGPWVHGGWARTDGDALGQARFGTKTAEFYREQVEKPFFDHHLLGGPDPALPEALVFDTGANEWGRFDVWPPRDLRASVLALGASGALTIADSAPAGSEIARFVSDPSKPVPHTSDVVIGMNKEYMTEDQRFAARRPDVVVFETPPLEADVTIAGPLRAVLRVATDSTDADWIVKLVDVFEDGAKDPQELPLAPGQKMGGYHMLVRGEVMPGRFRRGYETPVPFEPGVVDEVSFELWDVLHTFEKGHRIQIQVQSTWFPLVAANPQQFLANPWSAKPADRRAATHVIHAGSRIEIGILAVH